MLGDGQYISSFQERGMGVETDWEGTEGDH